MNALIVYDSTFGNTERIARAIAERIEGARLLKLARRKPSPGETTIC